MQPLQVSLSACGTGSAATWNESDGNPLLTVGTAPAATCGAPAGSTYDPAYAQIVIDLNYTGTAVPVPASTTGFDTTNYASGTPRMVIELANGHSLWGYPPSSGLNGSNMAWAVDNGNTYTDYATAYNEAGAASTHVTSAFVVADLSQPAGVTSEVSNLSYGGQVLQPTGFIASKDLSQNGSPLAFDVRNGVKANGTRVQVWEQGDTGSSNGNVMNQSFTPVPLGNGVMELRLMDTGLCLDNTGNAVKSDWQVWSCNGDRAQQFMYGTPSTSAPNGTLEAFGASTASVHVVADDTNGRGNSSLVQGWPYPGTVANEMWIVP